MNIKVNLLQIIMLAVSVFYVSLLFNSFGILSSSQVKSISNYSEENNNSSVKNVIFTTELSNTLNSSIESTTTTEEEVTTITTTVEEEKTETIHKVLQKKEKTTSTEDPWDKGVTLSSPKEGIATSTVVLAALCIALLVSICNVYCYGKTRGYT